MTGIKGNADTSVLHPLVNTPLKKGSDCSTRAHYSCNEVESLCFKATRGAGLPWGLAQEAGFAVCWLEQRGFAGAEALAALLDVGLGQWHDLTPQVKIGHWSSRGQYLCPIALGIALCDFVGQPEMELASHAPQNGLPIAPLYFPVLLLPFLAVVARQTACCVQIASHNNTLAVTPDGQVWGSDKARQIFAKNRIESCAIRILNSALPQQTSGTARVAIQVCAETIKHLQHYAALTYVPESEASRAGAGARISDND